MFLIIDPYAYIIAILLALYLDVYQLNSFGAIQLNPNSDQHLISPNNITAWSNLQIMRMIEMITKEEMSLCLNKFSQSLN